MFLSSSVANIAAINLTFVCLSADHSGWQLSSLVTDKSTAGGWRHTIARLVTMTEINPYPTAFPYGNGMVLHFYQQRESSTTKTVHKVINKGLKAYV